MTLLVVPRAITRANTTKYMGLLYLSLSLNGITTNTEAIAFTFYLSILVLGSIWQKMEQSILMI